MVLSLLLWFCIEIFYLLINILKNVYHIESVSLYSKLSPLLIVLLPVVLSYVLNKKSTEKINANNEKFQEKLNGDNNEFQEKMKKMDIDANIVSNSRINWIQETRTKTAEYISACYKVSNYFYSKFNRAPDTDMAKLEALKNDLREKSIQLGLYFGPDEININNVITSYIDNLSEIIIAEDGRDPFFWERINERVLLLRNFLSIYYKIEWQRSNGSITKLQAEERQKNNEYLNNLIDIQQFMDQKVADNLLTKMKTLYNDTNK